MSLCALHELGICDDMVSVARYATESWCESSNLDEADVAKIKEKGLCGNHSRHPGRARRPTTPSPPAKKQNIKSLRSPLSPPTTVSGLPRPSMADAVTQTEEKIEIETKTQACLGLNNPDLEKFVEHRFGKTIHNEEGYLWGKRNQGWATFRSEFCTGVARSYKANRCDDCHKLHSAMNLARSRKSESSEAHKFVPFSSLRVSPYVKELLERFKKENKGTTPKHVAREDDLEIDVSPLKFEIAEVLCTHSFFLQNPDDNDYLVKVCLKALEENPNIKDTFFCEVIKQQLQCATSVRGSFLFIFERDFSYLPTPPSATTSRPWKSIPASTKTLSRISRKPSLMTLPARFWWLGTRSRSATVSFGTPTPRS